MIMSVERKQIGWQLVPIYAPPPGSIVTQAFILCCACSKPVSTTSGPRQNAYCMECDIAQQAARWRWAKPILSGDDDAVTNRRTMVVAAALMLNQSTESVIDKDILDFKP